jgi:predicted RNase H-like nuclease (RuvC/YqgF family)
LEENKHKLASDLTKCESKIGSMVGKADLEAAEKAAAAAQSKLAKLEAELKAAKTQAEKLEKKASSAESELAKAQKTTSALEREVSQVKASFKTADKEALILRERVEEAENKLKDILEHHSSAWLPHWLEETAGKRLSSAGIALKDATATATTTAVRGGDIAITVMRTKVLPITVKYFWKAKAGGVTLATFVAKRLSEKNIVIPPNVKKAVSEAYEKFKASPYTEKAQVWSGIVKEHVATHGAVVVSELESLVVQAASMFPSLAPLGQKPVSTFVVYFVLLAPLLAIGMPLLASSRSKSRSKRAAAAASSSSQRSKASTSKSAGASSKKTPASKKRA